MEKRITVKASLGSSAPGTEVALAEGSRVADLLRQMGLLVEEHVVVMKGRVVSEFEILRDGDSLELLKAFSGG